MPRGKANQDTETLEMALLGFEQKKVEIEEKISQIRSLLGSAPKSTTKKSAKPKTAAEPETATRKRRTLSAAARKRIALAQKKRWAEHRKSLGESA